jgi:hypothetical protein
VYRITMTALLEKAIRKASALPEKEQEAIGALHDRAHSEIAAGQFSTLATYRASRRRKKKN